jgi:hypothetical protein
MMKDCPMKVSVLILCICFLFITSFSQYQNIRVSSATASAPEEVSIAINPANPLNLVGGANINYAYRSTDGGLTWSETRLTSQYGVWGDPCLTYDALGNAYFGHLSNSSSPGYWIDRIVVQKSTDGGATWNTGAGLGFRPTRAEQDKEWLIADMTNSQYRNNIYCSWTDFDSYGSATSTDSSRIVFSRSTDGGITWTTPVRLSDRAGDCIDSDNTVEGAVPAVGPNGDVYVSWSGPLGIMFDKSTDGGTTFGTDRFVSNQVGGWDYEIPGINRCNGLPITVCDISNSRHRGNIYINWTDQRNGADNTDVFLAKSTDGGTTWSSPKRVNTDATARHQFFTWMTVDQTTGFLYFVYYDRRSTTNNITDVYVARSIDGGETFTDFKVSQSSFNPVSSTFFGDYINIAAQNRKVYPIWMRLDGSTLSVWAALINDTTSIPTSVTTYNESPDGFRLLQNYPNPFNPSTTIDFYVGKSSEVEIEIFDIMGRIVSSLAKGSYEQGWHSIHWNREGTNSLSSGIYFYQMKALAVGDGNSRAFVERKKLVLLQ